MVAQQLFGQFCVANQQPHHIPQPLLPPGLVAETYVVWLHGKIMVTTAVIAPGGWMVCMLAHPLEPFATNQLTPVSFAGQAGRYAADAGIATPA